MTHRELAEALRQLQAEKAARINKEHAAREKELDEAEEKARRELQSFDEKRREALEKLRVERENLEKLRDQAARASEDAAREQEISDLQKRIIEFGGNDNSSLRERLIKEGWSEEVVFDNLKKRTLEQTLERPGGLNARFTQDGDWNALEKLMGDSVKPDDLKSRDVIYAMRDLRENATMKGYLSADERNALDRVTYLSDKFGQNEFYKEKDEHGYFSRLHDAADAIRKDLGLDPTTSTLTYGRNK
jgi:hypothetical protein